MGAPEKSRYKAICRDHPEIVVFMKDWWLDTVVGEQGWDVLILEGNGQLKAVWPLAFMRKGNREIVFQPSLTQTGGIYYFSSASQKENSRISFEHEAGGKLIDMLGEKYPGIPISQCFHSRFRNWLPFYWRGFSQSTYYTYRISAEREQKEIWESMSSKLRNEIRGAEKRLTVKRGEDWESLYSMFAKTYERRERKPPIKPEFVRSLVESSFANDAGRIYAAYDGDKLCSSVFIVNDLKDSFYLLGGTDYSIGNVNANGLLLWNAIKDSNAEKRSFDFEGSMNEGIEHFFRSFGSEQIPYFRIWRDPKLGNPTLKDVIRPYYSKAKKFLFSAARTKGERK